jgi:lysophospholipase L1-like esterase
LDWSDLESNREGQDAAPVSLIAALGSSFAAGPGIDPIVDEGAMRSGANYAHLLAEALGAKLVDLTVSGATTSNILDVPQQTMGGGEFPPQISGLPAEADLVTITAGGNDLQLIGSMLYAAWEKAEPLGMVTQILAGMFGGGIPITSEDDVDAVADGLTNIVTAVRQRATKSRVVLVDYLTVLTERTPTGPGKPFLAEELSALLHVQGSLAQAYRIAAHRSGAELMAVSALSVEHGIESLNPWVFGFQSDLEKTMASFHPNRDGMLAVAGELAGLLQT